MTDRLAQAVSVVLARCRVETAAIERIDVARDGTLTASVRTATGTRWFDVDERGCQELVPEQDPRLPLAAELPQLRQTGHVDVLSWRPRRRLVLRVDRDAATLVMKGYRADRARRAADRHELAAALLADTPLRVPELIARDSRRGAMLSRFSGGRPLGLGAASQERFFRVGAALRTMQLRPAPAGLAEHDAGAELAVLDDLASRIERVGAPLPAHWREARSRLDEHRPERVELATAHRDLHDGQLLVVGDELLLLDFDLLALADPLLDAANLLVHLKLRALQGRNGATAESALQCGRALLDGIDRDDDPDFASRLRFYQAGSFLRVALVHRLRPAWNALSSPLTMLALRCIDELVRL
ncbi:MAG TPA: phosphotransferase [Planctomycetota bacterium]|nr:phosphotransferase [Planctomycetota bacterium]